MSGERPREFFHPLEGDPESVCPNCGIWRKYAGNPAACGDGYDKPGCFAPQEPVSAASPSSGDVCGG